MVQNHIYETNTYLLYPAQEIENCLQPKLYPEMNTSPDFLKNNLPDSLLDRKQFCPVS